MSRMRTEGGRGTLEFRLLGPLEARLDDRPLPLGGVRQARAARASPPSSERGRLTRPVDRRALARPRSRERRERARGARRPPPPRTATRRPGHEIRRLRGEDRARCARPPSVRAPRRARKPSTRRRRRGRAAEQLHAALSLWRGPPLADFTYAPFAESTIGRLEGASASPCSRTGSTPTSRSAVTVISRASCSRSCSSTRSGSGCGPADARPSIRSGRQAEALEASGRPRPRARRARHRPQPRAPGARAGDPAPGPSVRAAAPAPVADSQPATDDALHAIDGGCA